MKWEEIIAKFGPAIPRYPEIGTVVLCARLPPPPVIRREEIADLGVLVRAHNAACFEWFARRGARLEDLDDAATALLGRAAEVLVVERIAPVAWCGFCCQVWTDQVASKRKKRDPARRAPPPLKWTYHEGRIRRHVEFGVFCEERFVDRLLLEPEHVELGARYQWMRYALCNAGDLDATKVKRIVDKFYSKTRVAKLVDKIEDKVTAKERELRRAITRGEWVWR